jgi:hypothetical protein
LGLKSDFAPRLYYLGSCWGEVFETKFILPWSFSEEVAADKRMALAQL